MFRYGLLLSSKIMTFIPSAAIGKVGIASTFILGAVIGTQLKKHVDKSSLHAHKERRNIRLCSSVKNDYKLEKQCNIVSKVHSALQVCQKQNLVDDLVTRFYVDRARKLCHEYLSNKGLLEVSTEITLEKWFEASAWIDNTDHWAPLPSLQHHDPPSYTTTLLSAVTALWHVSCIRERCNSKEFVNIKILKLLKLIIDENDKAATPFALKILANISAVKENHLSFTETGLVDILKIFSENSVPEFFLPAWRGLHNLNQSDAVYLEGVYPFNPPFLDKKENPVLDIILVHGVSGRASWTWREDDKGKFKPLISQEQRRAILNGHSEDIDALYSYCWPIDWLMPSLTLPVRILAVDYSADWQVSGNKYPTEARGKTISQHATAMAESLKAARVGDRPIVWICHSMGGLIAKYIIVNNFKQMAKDTYLVKGNSILQDQESPNEIAKQTVGMVFYSVPHHGAPLASVVSKPILRQLLQPTTEICEMKEESSLLTGVHESFLDIMKAQGTTILTLNETQPVYNNFLDLPVYFVPSDHGDPGIGTFHEVNATHLDICKPKSRKSSTYQKVEGLIQDIIKKV